MAKHSKAEIAAAKERLSEIKPGDTVYCILRKRSTTSECRNISLVVFKDGRPLHLDYNAAIILGCHSKGNGHGVRISGGGMDMGFALVSSLSFALFGDEYSLTHSWL